MIYIIPDTVVLGGVAHKRMGDDCVIRPERIYGRFNYDIWAYILAPWQGCDYCYNDFAYEHYYWDNDLYEAEYGSTDEFNGSYGTVPEETLANAYSLLNLWEGNDSSCSGVVILNWDMTPWGLDDYVGKDFPSDRDYTYITENYNGASIAVTAYARVYELGSNPCRSFTSRFSRTVELKLTRITGATFLDGYMLIHSATESADSPVPWNASDSSYSETVVDTKVGLDAYGRSTTSRRYLQRWEWRTRKSPYEFF
jgi:hypothetical protein